MEREFQVCVAEAVADGRTVFLSSHRLDEVERVCGRVGILRAGRLVEVAGLDDLRRLHRTELDVTYADPHAVPDDLAELPGVQAVHRPSPGRVVLTLTGAPGPVLRRVAAGDPLRLDVREASLEEIFLDFYGHGPA